MDITIVDGELSESRYTHVMRDEVYEDGTAGTHIHRMPKEILSLRAAEYDLPVDDPRVLDMVLLEHLILTDDLPDPHPLFAADSVKDALKQMEKMLDILRERHGQPKEKFLANAKNPSQGLIVVQGLLHAHTDSSVIEPVKYFRDKERSVVRQARRGLAESMRTTWMTGLQDDAHAEDRNQR